MALRFFLLAFLWLCACNNSTSVEYKTSLLTNEQCPKKPVPKLAKNQNCFVKKRGSDILLSGHVLLQTGVLYNGEVLIRNDKIQCVGCNCLAQAQTPTQIICPDSVISPGLINPHDHIGWMGEKPYVASNKDIRYEHRHDWRKGDPRENEPKISSEGNASVNEKIWGELRFVLSGATSTNASGVSNGLLRNLDRASGLEGLPSQPVTYETFPLGDSNGTKRDSNCNYPEIASLETVSGYASYTAHISEGIDKAAHNEMICSNYLGPNVAIVHGIAVNSQDVARIAEKGSQLIWSPRSNISLYGDTAPVTLYASLGVPIALGTDWLPTGSMNMLRELRCASDLNRAYYHNFFSAHDLWKMVTSNAALTLGVENYLGEIAVGKFADISVFAQHVLTDSDPLDMRPYRQAISSEVKDVALVLRGGKVLSGDANIVPVLANDCDAITVCEQKKQICLKREVNKTFAQLQTQLATPPYGLFYCDIPLNEPSCIPSRNEQERLTGSNAYTGALSETDHDGDGISNEQDNLPEIFNPIRPMDNSTQPSF